MIDRPIPAPDLVEEELARLFDSNSLRRAPSHARLLRYLVEKRLARDDAALRETAIAFEVFHRDPATYDPQMDPIVRVTVGRLRTRLDAHYAHYDSAPRLRIVLPKGGYTPEFVAVETAAPHARSGIAVLPARNLTGSPILDAFCAAFGDRLADHLSRSGVARVLVTAAGREGEITPRAAASKQSSGPEWLFDSTLAGEHAGEMRLSVRLVRAADASVCWIETAVASEADRYRLADRVTDAVVVRACATIPGMASDAPARAGTPLSEAQRNVVDTVRLTLLQRTLDGTRSALEAAQRLTVEAPDSAAAWSCLASALYSRLSFQDCDVRDLASRVLVAAERALVIDAEDAVAMRTKAIILGKVQYQLAAAESLFRQAIRAAPHYTSARLNLAELLALQGRFEDALVEVNLALIHDPLSASVRMARALCLTLAARYAAAQREWSLCRAAGDHSVFTLTGAGMCALAAGDREHACALLEEAHARHPELPEAVWFVAYGHCARDAHREAREHARTCVERFPDFSYLERARLSAMLRDHEAALENLDIARTRQDIQFLYAGVVPEFAWLAEDASFRRILSRAGLPGWRGHAPA